MPKSAYLPLKAAMLLTGLQALVNLQDSSFGQNVGVRFTSHVCFESPADHLPEYKRMLAGFLTKEFARARIALKDWDRCSSLESRPLREQSSARIRVFIYDNPYVHLSTHLERKRQVWAERRSHRPGVYPGHPSTFFGNSTEPVEILLTWRGSNSHPELTRRLTPMPQDKNKNKNKDKDKDKQSAAWPTSSQAQRLSQRQQLLKAIALHEFAHAFGLSHPRLTGPARQVCNFQVGGRLDDKRLQAIRRWKTSVYDPESVMNACHFLYLEKETGEPTLSQGDLMRISMNLSHLIR